jgi:hypothetical protein
MLRRLSIANEFGITTIKQLSVFLLHSKQNYSIIRATSPENYPKHYAIVRKLMLGGAKKAGGGLNLLKFEFPNESSKKKRESDAH